MSIKKITCPLYRVQAGENLKIVCEKLNISASELLLCNRLCPKDIKEGVLLALTRQ